MAHTTRDKQKLLNRVRRLKGQLTAVERGLESEVECSEILRRIAACRGALNALMSEVIEGHIRFHIVNPDVKPNTRQADATRELIDIVKGYLN